MAWIDHKPIGSGATCEKCDAPREKHRVDHVADGEPCSKCGLPSKQHRSEKRIERKNARKEHIADDDPCTHCGLPAAQHRTVGYIERKYGPRTDVSPSPANTSIQPKEKAIREQKEKEEPRPKKIAKPGTIYVGVDGEGQGREDHRYVLLAAAALDTNESSSCRKWYVKNKFGLSTIQCLNFLLWLPKKTKLFTYSFNYDLTMMLRDMPDSKLYLLFRPDLPERQRPGIGRVKGPKPVRWRGFSLNLQGTKFTISKGTRRVVIWDLFKFFQSKFVSALRDWKVGSEQELDEMERMKNLRNEFDKLDMSEIKDYCFDECLKMAELGKRLIEAHEAVGLKLKSYYGAGSSGAAMLTAMDINKAIVPLPKELKYPASCAFFGGRFENSVIGVVEGPVYNFDISSAYPYHITFLPCMIHGRWEHTTKREDINTARAACIHYGLKAINTGIESWGPFPFREKNGNICYPINSGGGWVWKDEYLAGERIFPHVYFYEAWVYRTECDCQPFKKIPEYYNERCRIGKEGPGLVLKLGCNSCYGKLAQSVGRGIFQSWVWAGMITSGCRAQVLDVLALHSDWRNLLMIATDGIYTREDIKTPIPDDTGTNIEINGKIKPLGGWERKQIDKGVFVARPGIYFPMNPTLDEIKDVRGRGVGKSVVLQNWQAIVDAWDHYDGKEINITDVTRFCGAKSSISRRGKDPDAYVYERAWGAKGLPSYGQWISRSVKMSLNPKPKRSNIMADNTLELRDIDYSIPSTPYNRAIKSIAAAEMEKAKEEAIEQPDVDFVDYEIEEGME